METELLIDKLKLEPTKGQLITAGWFSFFLIGIALFMFYLTNLTGWYYSTPPSPSKISLKNINLFFGLILSFGLWGCFRLTQMFKLAPIYSNLDKSKKAIVINNLTNTFKWSVESTSSDSFRFYYYKNILVRRPLIVIILTDEKGFYVNVMSVTLEVYDFGRNYSITELIKKEIEKELVIT